MSATGKRAMFVRTAVVLGLLAYIGLVFMATFSLVLDQASVLPSQSARFPGFMSNTGMLITLAVAGPFVLITAVKYWRDPNRE